jgi:hypothetical protein
MSHPDLAAKSANRLTGFGRSHAADVAPKPRQKADALGLFAEAKPGPALTDARPIPNAQAPVNPGMGTSFLDGLTLRRRTDEDPARAAVLSRCAPAIRQSKAAAGIDVDALAAWNAIYVRNVRAQGPCSVQRGELADATGCKSDRAQQLVDHLVSLGLVRVRSEYLVPRLEAIVQ